MFPSLPALLEPLRERIEAASAPCIVLSPALHHARRGTRFGGEPLLPPGATWPRSDRGPLSFLGQLDFAELSRVGGAALGLPGTGSVALFYDVEGQPWGTEPGHADGFALVVCDESAQPAELPDDAIPFDEEPLALSAAPSLPSPASPEGAALLEGEPDAIVRAYAEHLEALAAEQVPHGVAALRQQVGGHAPFVSRDVRLVASLASAGASATHLDAVPRDAVARARREAQAWQLLWQLEPHDDRFTWAASGSLFVLVRGGDLGRAWVVYEPG